jgi:mannobiose 2-epimerase
MNSPRHARTHPGPRRWPLFIAVLAGTLLDPCPVANAQTATQSAPLRLSLDVEDLRSLRRRIDGLLTDELTRLWYPRAVDRDGGGFHQNFGRDWAPRPDADRFLVYQSRMTWTAAAFARFSPRHREAFQGYARHGVEFLDRVMRDREHGGFHWALGHDGQVDARIGTEKHVYGTAFALYAASEAFRATSDPRALAVAREAYDWLERHAHDRERGGYFEALTREGRPLVSRDPKAPRDGQVDRLGVYYGFKSMNSHIHLLEAVAAFARVESAPEVKERLRELLGVVRDKIAVEPGALNLYLTRDWRAAPAHDSFGHDVETAYLLVEASEALGAPDDPATWRVARMLVDHALDWGWDGEHGGFYDKGDVFAGGPYDTTKVWWTQAEGLNALLLMHTKFRGETDRYGRAFLKQWSFIEAHQLDPVHGGWFMETTRAGALIGDGRKATPWKANYHTARALMNVFTMLGELTGDSRGDEPASP